MSKEQIGLVVDATYLYAAKDVIGSNVNYGALMQAVAAIGEVRHAVCHVKANPGQRKFLGALKAHGFTVVSKAGNPDGDHWVSDVADSIMGMCRHVDHMVIAVGDDRYAPIIEWVWATWGCKVTLIGLRPDLMGEAIQEILADKDIGTNFLEVDASFAYAAAQPAHADAE